VEKLRKVYSFLEIEVLPPIDNPRFDDRDYLEFLERIKGYELKLGLTGRILRTGGGGFTDEGWTRALVFASEDYIDTALCFAVHETGHLLGMDHCNDDRCYMSYISRSKREFCSYHNDYLNKFPRKR
jgi:hypothetical protein